MFRVKFTGKEANAVGNTCCHEIEIDAPPLTTLEELRLKAYDTHEHITQFEIVPQLKVIKVEFIGKCADIGQTAFTRQTTHVQVRTDNITQDSIRAQLEAGNVHGFNYVLKKNQTFKVEW